MRRSIISTIAATALLAFASMLVAAGSLAAAPAIPEISIPAFDEAAAIEEVTLSLVPGRIVQLCLSESCAQEINARRDADYSTGNRVEPGEIVPMVIVKVWSETTVNGQAILDGSDSLWCTSVTLDTATGETPTPGTWRWPERVG